MPKPVWTYPLHYISFHSYTFYGFMQNEFENTDVSGEMELNRGAAFLGKMAELCLQEWLLPNFLQQFQLMWIMSSDYQGVGGQAHSIK
eukprot:1136272-Pelagomonas_calceolata.AAC.5